MNVEHKALAEYLDQHLDKRFKKIDEQFKEVNRNIYNLTMHVDVKNDKQDEAIDDHELRIGMLESDGKILTS